MILTAYLSISIRGYALLLRIHTQFSQLVRYNIPSYYHFVRCSPCQAWGHFISHITTKYRIRPSPQFSLISRHPIVSAQSVKQPVIPARLVELENASPPVALRGWKLIVLILLYHQGRVQVVQFIYFRGLIVRAVESVELVNKQQRMEPRDPWRL